MSMTSSSLKHMRSCFLNFSSSSTWPRINFVLLSLFAYLRRVVRSGTSLLLVMVSGHILLISLESRQVTNICPLIMSSLSWCYDFCLVLGSWYEEAPMTATLEFEGAVLRNKTAWCSNSNPVLQFLQVKLITFQVMSGLFFFL